MTNPRIYLDNAATSWPKPEAVYAAVDHYQREVGGPNGRSGYREALEANRIVERARQGVAELIGAADPSHVVFGFNGTDVLNLAIRGVVRNGDHVITTVCDHNSVLRPLRALREAMDVDVTYMPCNAQGFVSPEEIRVAIRPNTRLVAVVHASNVTGAIQPIAEIGRAVRGECAALILFDAAQSLGHVPIDVQQLEVDLLAAPGHKGLLGPLGTGVLYIRPGVEAELQPLRCGGTGTQSEEDSQPTDLPEKYESGNHNLIGLAGLAAAAEFLRSTTIEAVQAHHAQLAERLLEGLREITGVTIHGPPTTENRTSVVSITVEGYDPQELAAVLESARYIQCRAGLHCAPRMHQALRTTERGGTLRFSPGYSTTLDEIDAVIWALQEVTGATIPPPTPEKFDELASAESPPPVVDIQKSFDDVASADSEQRVEEIQESLDHLAGVESEAPVEEADETLEELMSKLGPPPSQEARDSSDEAPSVESPQPVEESSDDVPSESPITWPS